MSDQNPHPGDIRHSQIPMGSPTPPRTPPPSPSGLTLIGALKLLHKFTVKFKAPYLATKMIALLMPSFDSFLTKLMKVKRKEMKCIS